MCGVFRRFCLKLLEHRTPNPLVPAAVLSFAGEPAVRDLNRHNVLIPKLDRGVHARDAAFGWNGVALALIAACTTRAASGRYSIEAVQNFCPLRFCPYAPRRVL